MIGRFSSALLALAATLSACGDTAEITTGITAPLIGGFNGNPEGIAAAAAPWQEGFFTVVTAEEPEYPTRFKAFHDNDWLYVAVECREDMARVAALPKLGPDSRALFLEDSVEINIDPSGTGLGFSKYGARPTGDYADLYALDDNTGSERFADDYAWNGGARLRVSAGKDSWLAEFAIPLGPLVAWAKDPSAEWLLLVGRTRLPKRGKWDCAAWPKGATAFTKPSQFGRIALKGLDAKAHEWRLKSGNCAARPQGEGFAFRAAGTIGNRTGAARDIKVRASLTDINGKTLAEAETGTIRPADGGETPFEVSFAGVRGGAATLHFDLYAGDRLERSLVRDVRIEYEPVKIRLTKPCYRDCVFDTMKLDRIEGEVVLEEGVGKPLEIALTGEGTSESLPIASAAVTNRFSFPFAGKPKGDYLITANGAKRRIRNLSFHPGEVWFDADGVAYREGVKFMPWGFFQDIFTDRDPDINVAHRYWSGMDKPETLRELCRDAGRLRRGFILSPKQRFGTGGRELFDAAGERGDLTDAQKAELKAFADIVRGEPWFMAYYMSDEPEGRYLNPEWFRAAREYMTEIDPYHPTIMLNYSIDGTRRFGAGGDVSCPDAYPVYLTGGTARDPRRITYDKAKAASESAQAKFAGWITPQLFDWDNHVKGEVSCGPDYDQLREQALLALAGDARGFLWYSRCTLGVEVTEHQRLGPAQLHRELEESRDVFLSPTRTKELAVRSSGPDKTMIAALKRFGGETLIIAVNTSGEEVEAEFSGRMIPGALYVNGEGEPISGKARTFKDRFRPYEAKVYYDSVKQFGHTAGRQAVYAAEAGRRAPGNLAAAPQFLTWEQMVDRAKAGCPADWYPRIVTSSSLKAHYNIDYAYLLQDGIRPEAPFAPFCTWAPEWTDEKPWVRVEFGAPKRFNRIVLHRPHGNTSTRPALVSGTIEVNGRTVASFDDAEVSRLEIRFPEVEAEAVTVRLGKMDRKAQMRLLTEVEVFHDGRIPDGDTVGDRLWMWGHHGNCLVGLKDGEAGSYGLPCEPRIDMADACREMGIPGCYVVRWTNKPAKAELDDYMRGLKDLKRIAFSITDQAEESFDEKVEMALRYADTYTNLTTVVMDDFWCEGYSQPVEKVRRVREEFARRGVKLSVVLYGDKDGVKSEFGEILSLCDEVTFWFWRGRNIGDIERQVTALRKLIGPDKPIRLGLYMWDFGGRKELPGEAMERQLAAAERLLFRGDVQGLIFHCTPLVDMDLEAVRISKDWIRKNAARPVADVTLDTDRFRLVIGPDAQAKSLKLKASGEEMLDTTRPAPLFSVTQDRPFTNELKLEYPSVRTTYPANRVRLEGDRLIVGFEGFEHEAVIGMRKGSGYVAFTLEDFRLHIAPETVGLFLDQPQVSEFRLLQLPVRERANYGSWLNAMWDERTAVCVAGCDALSRIWHEDRENGRLLTADLIRGSRLRSGSAAILAGNGREDFLDAMDGFERDFDLPRGVEARRSPLLNRSSIRVSEINPANVDEFIALCRKGGFELMLIYYTAMCKTEPRVSYSTLGDYEFREEYPNGFEDLKRMIAKIKAAGITPGLHILQTHIGVHSRYVTPVLDPRLNKKMRFTLKGALPKDGEVGEILVEENPTDAPLHDKVRVLAFGGEAFSYESYTTERPYRFRGVKRGHYGTTPAAHPKGEIGGVLDVCEYIANSIYIDQSTDLQDEVAEKIAKIYDCGFEFLYMDGSEGVNPPCGINVALAQDRVIRHLGRMPRFAEGAAKNHYSWHILSGGNAFDPYEPKYFKDAIVRYPQAEAKRMLKNMTRVNFGWWCVYLDTTPDLWEFGEEAAFAAGSPITLLVWLQDLAKNPHADELLEVTRRWEERRRSSERTAK